MYGLPYYGDDSAQTTATGLVEETDYVGLLEEYGPLIGRILGDSAEEDYEQTKVDYERARADCASGKNSYLEPLGLGPCKKASNLQARLKALKARADYERTSRYFGIAFRVVALFSLAGLAIAGVRYLQRKE